jgi:hypothetical protein
LSTRSSAAARPMSPCLTLCSGILMSESRDEPGPAQRERARYRESASGGRGLRGWAARLSPRWSGKEAEGGEADGRRLPPLSAVWACRLLLSLRPLASTRGVGSGLAGPCLYVHPTFINTDSSAGTRRLAPSAAAYLSHMSGWQSSSRCTSPTGAAFSSTSPEPLPTRRSAVGSLEEGDLRSWLAVIRAMSGDLGRTYQPFDPS